MRIAASRAGGFTLLEALVVVVILGILLAAGVVGVARWRAMSAVTQGAQEFSQAVRTTRSGAKRANACWQISLVAYSATNTQYQVKEYGGPACSLGATPAPLRTRIYTAPPGTQLVRVDSSGTVSGTATTINFVPPYGTSDSAPDNFQVRWTAQSAIRRDVRVTGIFGKVIIR